MKAGILAMADGPDNDFRLSGKVDVPLNKETVGRAWQGAKKTFVILSVTFNFISWGIMYLVNHKVDVRNADIQTSVTQTVAQDFEAYKKQMEAKQAADFAAYKKATDERVEAKINDAVVAFEAVKAYFQLEITMRRSEAERRRAQGMIDFIEQTKARLKQNSQAEETEPATATTPLSFPALYVPHSWGKQ